MTTSACITGMGGRSYLFRCRNACTTSRCRGRRILPAMADTTIPEVAFTALLDALDKANDRTSAQFPGDSPDRQPVHTVYGGAHLFKADAAVKLSAVALKSLQEHAPDAETIARVFDRGTPHADRINIRVNGN